jgi:hypothetical protein
MNLRLQLRRRLRHPADRAAFDRALRQGFLVAPSRRRTALPRAWRRWCSEHDWPYVRVDVDGFITALVPLNWPQSGGPVNGLAAALEGGAAGPRGRWGIRPDGWCFCWARPGAASQLVAALVLETLLEQPT